MFSRVFQFWVTLKHISFGTQDTDSVFYTILCVGFPVVVYFEMENLTLIFAGLLLQPGLLMLNEKINAARSHFSTDFLHFQPRWSQICNAKPKFRAQSAITTACRILHDVYLLQLQNLNTKNKSSQSPLLFMLLDCCRHKTSEVNSFLSKLWILPQCHASSAVECQVRLPQWQLSSSVARQSNLNFQ